MSQFMYFVIGESIGKIRRRLINSPFYTTKFKKILQFSMKDLKWKTPNDLPSCISDAEFLCILQFYSNNMKVISSLVPNLLDLNLGEKDTIYIQGTYYEFHSIFYL